MKRLFAAFVVVSLALMFYFAWPDSTRSFAKYVCSPVPMSVENVRFHGNDLFGLDPEPVCYLGFNASADDMGVIIKRKGFQPSDEKGWVAGRGGPVWWKPDERDAKARVYHFSHRPPQSRWRV